ncbi:molybdate ABC transporter permease subunit [Caulobacter sp. S45]|jgi:molybdate transport system permease protein|uniref:molybdate ABC transporter permease subunit n=1 Tax=Caulobacter sp. S45 TaxID=1641861 RepID=UPI00131EA3CC|nr:molybdate ABC transporter permease subunit [Caulobacter sp. S45]
MTPDETSALIVSLIVSLRAVIVALPLAIAVAWLLARGRFVGRTALDLLVHTPLVLPPVLVGYGLLVLLGVHGPVGALLDRTLHIRLPFTSAGASLAAGVMAFPLMVRAVRLSLEAVDPALEIAARSLGAGWADRMLSVTLPLAAPGVIAAAIVGFAACLGEFGAVITFAANVPGVTQTLPMAIYSTLQTPGAEASAGRLAAISFTLAIVALGLSEWLARKARAWSGR